MLLTFKTRMLEKTSLEIFIRKNLELHMWLALYFYGTAFLEVNPHKTYWAHPQSVVSKEPNPGSSPVIDLPF